MKIPTATAREALDAWKWHTNGKGADAELGKNIEYVGDGNKLTDTDFEPILGELKAIQEKHGDSPSDSQKTDIDIAVSKLLHRELSSLAEVWQLGYEEFWLWFSNIACDGYFCEFIKWRFGDQRISPLNWCIHPGGIHSKTMTDGYFPKLWLRAHMVYDGTLENPYQHVKKGMNFWDKCIFRSTFVKTRENIRALVDFQGSSPDDEMIQKIRRWTSNSTFSNLTYKECLAKLETIDNTPL